MRWTGILEFQTKSALEIVLWILVALIVYHLNRELRGVYVRICIVVLVTMGLTEQPTSFEVRLPKEPYKQ